MKRKLLLCGAVIAAISVLAGAPTAVYAVYDWVQNGNNIYYTGGNVGIGTSTPISDLDVNGDMLVRYGSIFLTGSENANYRIHAEAWNTGLQYRYHSGHRFFVNSNESAIEAMTIKVNGYVGIGNPNPTCQLDVQGTIRANDVYGAGGQNIIVGDDTYLTDLDQPNTLGVRGTNSYVTKTVVKLGTGNATIVGYNNGDVCIGNCN